LNCYKWTISTDEKQYATYTCTFIASIFLFPVNAWSAYKTRLSDTHIQSSLVRHFPIREYAAFARVTLHEPQVVLSRDSKELLLVIPIDANIPDQSQKRGHARIAVKVSYRPGNGGLYLNNPRVVKFEMPNISKNMAKQLKVKITTICLNSLPLIQIYKLKEKDLNHSLAKSILKSYSVRNGSVSLVFGFN
jgi:hypothetical protein